MDLLVELIAVAAGGGLSALVLGGLALRGARSTPQTLPADQAPTKDLPAKTPEKAEPKAPPPPKKTDAEAMRAGLSKTRTGFLGKLNALLGGDQGLDEETLEELETLLVTSDVGIKTATQIIAKLDDSLSKDEKKDPAAIRAKLEGLLREMLGDKVKPWTFDESPKVVMVIGVNGVGKTTTIGKLAARYAADGKKVLLGAGDTFRAAAVEQLEIWGTRADVPVVKGDEGADPASVIFNAVEQGKRQGVDVVLCDTAGRLQNKVNLMNELGKVRKVMNKAMEGAPHEVLMVLDATTGQNAISQAKKFSETVPVTSLALTKLDGTAKGGVVIAIAHELGIPVRFVGVGEGADDLRDFDPDDFVSGLFADGAAPKRAETTSAVDAPAADS